MQLPGHSPPLAFLRLKNLAADPASLALELDQLGHVMDADKDMPRPIDRQRGNDQVEIIAAECAGPLVNAAETLPRAGTDVLEGLQDLDCAVIAAFDQAPRGS